MDTKSRVRTTDGIDGKDAVGLYLDGIARTPLLNAAEEVALARRIEAGVFARAVLEGHAETTSDATTEELHQIAADGDEALAHFVRANLRLVVSVARKYGRSQMPLLDLVQEGNTGLIRAVEKFDYAKGFKFSTYATWWVRQAISRGIAQQGRIVRLPVHVAEQVNQVSAARRNLERQLGREPETFEIADELEITEERVIELIRFGRDHVSTLRLRTTATLAWATSSPARPLLVLTTLCSTPRTAVDLKGSLTISTSALPTWCVAAMDSSMDAKPSLPTSARCGESPPNACVRSNVLP